MGTKRLQRVRAGLAGGPRRRTTPVPSPLRSPVESAAMARADGSTRYPRSRLEKLGIGGDARVLLIDLDDPAFEAEVRERTPHVIVGQTRRKGFTVIIVRL